MLTNHIWADCYESAMKVLWKCYEIILLWKMLWKMLWNQSAMKALWNQSAMKDAMKSFCYERCCESNLLWNHSAMKSFCYESFTGAQWFVHNSLSNSNSLPASFFYFERCYFLFTMSTSMTIALMSLDIYKQNRESYLKDIHFHSAFISSKASFAKKILSSFSVFWDRYASQITMYVLACRAYISLFLTNPHTSNR